MNERQKYFDRITMTLDGIKHTVINHNIQPDDLMDIWAAGLACTSSLCPEKLGTNQLKTSAEMDAMGAIAVEGIPSIVVAPKM